MPGTGAECCSTTPGSRWPVGIITQTPWTSSKNRSSEGSLATPFCSDTTGVDAGSTEVRSSTAACVWWLLTASSTVTGSARVAEGLAGVPRGGYVDRAGALRGRQRQPVAAEHVEVRPARHEDHVVAGLVQQSAEHPADRPGAVHHPSHGVSLPAVNQR